MNSAVGSWVTWSIVNWHNSYICLFFPKLSDGLQFFCLSTTEAWTFCKMNPLNPLRSTSHQKNWEKGLLFNLRNDCLLNLANSHNDNFFHSQWSLVVILSENRCHFVYFLSFVSSYLFFSLRKIMWLNSQDFLLWTQIEALYQKRICPVNLCP